MGLVHTHEGELSVRCVADFDTTLVLIDEHMAGPVLERREEYEKVFLHKLFCLVLVLEPLFEP